MAAPKAWRWWGREQGAVHRRPMMPRHFGASPQFMSWGRGGEIHLTAPLVYPCEGLSSWYM